MHVHSTDNSRAVCEEIARWLRNEGQSAEAVSVTFYDSLYLELCGDSPDYLPLHTDDAHCVVVL
jgi:hypothetical protein